MYEIIPTRIPQDRRAEINEKILYVIDSGKQQLSREVIYNTYTGKGGLHGLSFSEYRNYNEFASAKKEVEEGQFFTPHEECRKICDILAVREGETFLDPCVGMGNILNWLPDQSKATGRDIDANAVKVASYLYPKADIKTCDIRMFEPEGKFSTIFINPPFDLPFEMDGERMKSQMFFCLKTAQWLEPAGLLALLVPRSFLADEFWNASDVKKINERYSFIGQTVLDSDAFAAVGVENFSTKLMLFSRRCESIPHKDYDQSFFCSHEQLKTLVADHRQLRHKVRTRLVRETLMENEKDEQVFYKIKRILFHLHHNPMLKKQYEGALAYIEKYRTQKPPENATREQYLHWEKFEKITPEKVLAYCRKALRKQSIVQKDEIRLVYDKGTVYPKGCSDAMQRKVKDICNTNGIPLRTSRTNLVSNSTDIKSVYPEGLFGPAFDSDLKGAERRFSREHRDYLLQSTPFQQLTRDEETDHRLDNTTFRNASGKVCTLTDLQKKDLGLVLQKRYAILNWQQGSGKTAAALIYSRCQMSRKNMTTCFVVAPALAVNLTWIPFLKANSIPHRVIRKTADIRSAQKGEYLLVPMSMVNVLKKELMEYVRKVLGNRVCLLLDESDELSNPRSVRTRAVLDIFRRVRCKLLLTGTTTRNNIGELYSQMELLYNNSVNMLCTCPSVYEWDKDTESFVSTTNDHYGKPFPARRGHGVTLFRSCFSPGKATVFGIKKFDQNVYNSEQLSQLIQKTILTRRFRDFAGDKYGVENHTVCPTEAEFGVYKKILCDLQSLVPLYFHQTGDSRKESALRIMRTIQLLIKACSVPHLMPGYNGESQPSKLAYILRMLEEREGVKVAVGTTTIEALEVYADNVRKVFAHRPLFVVDGSVTFDRRKKIIAEFENSTDGILLCTQQSLKSSVNIPSCDEVILESLQWNLPKMSQFFFRFIRFDSERFTNVHFVTYQYTIEQNILALLLTKERLNEYVKDGEIASQEDMFSQYGVSSDLFNELMGKESDKKGLHFTWGEQRLFE